MRGRFLVGSILAWSLCILAPAQARTSREADRARAIDQMEKRLQATASAKRSPLSTKVSGFSNPVQSAAPAPAKASSNIFERIFGKPGSAPEGNLRPVSGKSPRPAAKAKLPGDSGRPESARDGGNTIAWDSGAASGARAAAAAAEPASAPASAGTDLKRLVGSLLSHMTTASGGGSDGSLMEAGSFQFEDYVYEQRKRNAVEPRRVEVPQNLGRGDAVTPPVAPDRLLELLAQDEGREVKAPPAAMPEKKRETSTALLGAVASEAAQMAEAPPAATGAELSLAGEPATGDGRSSIYKKATAKLRTYEVPPLPPLRPVSGYQGLMTTKPSEQTVEGGRGGVLSALQLK